MSVIDYGFLDRLEYFETEYGFNDNRTIIMFNKIALKYLREKDYENALNFVEKIGAININFFKKNDFLAKSFCIGARAKFELKQYDEALNYYNISKSFVKDSNNDILFRLHLLKAQICEQIGNREESISCYKKCIKDHEMRLKNDPLYFKKIDLIEYTADDSIRIQMVYSKVAEYYTEKGDFDKAQKYYKNVDDLLQVAYEDKNDIRYCEHYDNMAKFNLYKKDLNLALIYAKKAFDIRSNILEIPYNDEMFSVLVSIYTEYVDFENLIEQDNSYTDNIKATLFLLIGEYYYKNGEIEDSLVSLMNATSYVSSEFSDISLRISNKIGFCFYKLGDYIGAIEYFENELEKRFGNIEDNHIQNIYAKECICRCYFLLNDMPKAFKVYDEIEGCQISGAYFYEYQKNCEEIGIYCYKNKFYKNSKAFFEKSIKILEQELKATDLFNEKMGLTYNYIGKINFELNKYKEAELNLFKSLVYLEKQVPMKLELIYSVHHDLGMFYEETSNLDKALKHYKISYEVKIENYGSMNVDTIDELFSVAKVECDLKQYKNASENLEKCLEGYTKLLPKNNIKRINVLDMLAICYYILGLDQRSIDVNLEILSIYNEYNKIDGVDIKHILEAIAATYYKMMKYDEALFYYNMVLQYNEEIDTERSSAIFKNIGYTFENLYDYENAISSYNLIISKMDVNDPANFENLYDVYYDIYTCYYRLKDFDNAMIYAKEAKSTIEKLYGEESFQTFTAHKDIANILLMQEKYDEALIYFNKSIFIRKMHIDKNYTNDISKVYFDVATLYMKQDMTKNAIYFYRSILDLLEKMNEDKSEIYAKTYKELIKAEQKEKKSAVNKIIKRALFMKE